MKIIFLISTHLYLLHYRIYRANLMNIISFSWTKFHNLLYEILLDDNRRIHDDAKN